MILNVDSSYNSNFFWCFVLTHGQDDTHRTRLETRDNTLNKLNLKFTFLSTGFGRDSAHQRDNFRLITNKFHTLFCPEREKRCYWMFSFVQFNWYNMMAETDSSINGSKLFIIFSMIFTLLVTIFNQEDVSLLTDFLWILRKDTDVTTSSINKANSWRRFD